MQGVGRRRLLPLVPLLAAPRSAAPASAGTGSGPAEAVIARAEQLRGLTTTRPLAVSTVERGGHAARSSRGELTRERQPRSDAAWDDALHLLGVLKRGQTLEAVQRSQLTGQVAGVYVPRTGRLYVLGAGGKAPRSVIAHEVVHALQDEHFDLAGRGLRAAPARSRRRLAAHALVEGDATDVQSRYVASLSPRDLVGELARTLGSLPAGAAASGTPRYLERQLLFPYTAGQAFVRALRAHGGQRLLDRAFAHPPRTTAAVLDPARYLAGDPPAQAGRAAGRQLPLHDHVRSRGRGRADRDDGLARGWLGGRLGVGARGLDLRLADAQRGRRGGRAATRAAGRRAASPRTAGSCVFALRAQPLQ